MKQPANEHRFFYVDEAGDPAFYAKGKKLIVGENGCSRTSALGFLRTNDPEAIRNALSRLRVDIAADRYLQAVPSFQKTIRSFHAKDDCPEVRKAVFEVLNGLDFSAQVIVARKIESIFVNRHKQSQDRFYNDLTSRLFERPLHVALENTITFARRGNKSKQHALRTAVEAGVSAFRKKYPQATSTSVLVQTASSGDDELLQAVDYALWAVQRAFEKREMRYFDFLASKFSLVWDIYDFDTQQRTGSSVFSKRNPFSIEKVSPLS